MYVYTCVLILWAHAFVALYVCLLYQLHVRLMSRLPLGILMRVVPVCFTASPARVCCGATTCSTSSWLAAPCASYSKLDIASPIHT